jgi:hypothetical protein
VKTYQVTITPKVTSYAGRYTDSKRIVNVEAKDRNEAISQVRKARMLEEGRHGVAATYTAKAWKYDAPVRDEFGTNDDEYGQCWWR